MSICLEVKVIPNSKVSEIDGNIIRVKSPPRDNKANGEVVKLISKKYKVPPSKIKIIGTTSRKKKIIIKD